MESNFDLVYSLAQLNLAYLGIILGALTIILGGLYLFSISPLKDTLKKQEELLTKLRSGITKKIQKLETETLPNVRSEIKSDFSQALKNSTQSFQSVFTKELEKTKSSVKDIRTLTMIDVDNKIESFKNSDISFIKNNQVENERLLRKIEESNQNHIDNLKNMITSMEKKLSDLKYTVRELEGYKYSQEGKMGGIISQLDLLEIDLKEKRWNLKHRLPDIKKELEKGVVTTTVATRLRRLLDQVTEEGLIEVVDGIRKEILIKDD